MISSPKAAVWYPGESFPCLDPTQGLEGSLSLAAEIRGNKLLIIRAGFLLYHCKKWIYKSQFIFISGLGNSKAVVLILNCLFYGWKWSWDVNDSTGGLGSSSNHGQENWHWGLPNTPQIPNFIKFNNATVPNHPRTKYSNEILFEVRNIIEIWLDVCEIPHITRVVQIVLNGPEIIFRKENRFLFSLTQSVCHRYAFLSTSC